MRRERPAPRFADRREAGLRLAEALAARGFEDPLVVGLARGGVSVAAAVATGLGAPLDLLVVRKAGHPARPELALGAATADGHAWVEPGFSGVAPATVRAGLARAAREAREMEDRLRARIPARPIRGRTCVLVDDGLATGATMRAAVRWARARSPARLVVAVPVGGEHARKALEDEVEEVVCLAPLEGFRAVGEAYDDFSQIGEEEAVALVAATRRRTGARRP